MYKNKKILCIIPARGGSKGLPGKNVKLLCGKPLIAHTIEQAKSCRYLDRIVVSTEDKSIAAAAKKFGAEVLFLRPKRLAKDKSGTIDVLLHAMDWMENKEKFGIDVELIDKLAELYAKETKIMEDGFAFVPSPYDEKFSEWNEEIRAKQIEVMQALLQVENDVNDILLKIE